MKQYHLNNLLESANNFISLLDYYKKGNPNYIRSSLGLDEQGATVLSLRKTIDLISGSNEPEFSNHKTSQIDTDSLPKFLGAMEALIAHYKPMCDITSFRPKLGIHAKDSFKRMSADFNSFNAALSSVLMQYLTGESEMDFDHFNKIKKKSYRAERVSLMCSGIGKAVSNGVEKIAKGFERFQNSPDI